MAEKKQASQANIWISLIIAAATLLFLTYVYDSSKEGGKKPEGTLASPGRATDASPQGKSSLPVGPVQTQTRQQAQPRLPDDLAKSLAAPPPDLPPDLKAQLNSPPPELPEDLKRQLMNPPKELPPDLKAQLEGPKPELPDDIKKALATPPRIVTLDEVNNPPPQE
jgi:hypothetical protein